MYDVVVRIENGSVAEYFNVEMDKALDVAYRASKLADVTEIKITRARP